MGEGTGEEVTFSAGAFAGGVEMLAGRKGGRSKGLTVSKPSLKGRSVSEANTAGKRDSISTS